MLIEFMFMSRASDTDSDTEIDASYGYTEETVPSVTWTEEEDFGQ